MVIKYFYIQKHKNQLNYKNKATQYNLIHKIYICYLNRFFA